jgi:hypothetical protein
MLIPSENRERAAMFDFAVETTHEALTHLDIAESLGPLAADLELVNKTAFLPDFRHGTFQVPPSYAHEPSVAIVPISDGMFEFGDLRTFVQPIFDQPICAVPFSKAFIAKTYGLDLTAEGHRLITAHGTAVDPLLTRGVSSTSCLEAFTWQGRACLREQQLYAYSRPVVMVRYSTLLQEDSATAAATVIHEESHAIDQLIHGAMTGLLKFAVSGELRANYADHTVLTGYGRQIPDEMATLEDLRVLANARATSPFRPASKLVDFMLRYCLV